ncbi:hypothetical protein GS452_00005 [Rhodococcus hoagii]|nr:hypothetical protein [Prescottella equi]
MAERTANHSIQAMPAHWSLYSTSVGRVLLTDKTSAEIREMYSGQKLRSARVDGVGSVDDLVEAVTRAREDGHSIVVDEFEVDSRPSAYPCATIAAFSSPRSGSRDRRSVWSRRSTARSPT